MPYSTSSTQNEPNALELDQNTLKKIRELAAKLKITPDEAVRRAIATEEFIEEQLKMNKIIIESPTGEKSRLEYKKKANSSSKCPST